MQKEGTLVPLSRKFYPSLPESRCLGFGLSKGALDKTAGHLPGHSSMHCFPRPTMPLRPTAPGSQPLLALPIPCFLQAPCADMGSCTRAHCVAGALDFTRLLCAVLGIVVIMVVPSIIKLQVHKSVCVWTPVACPSAYGRRSLFPSTSLSTSLTCQPQGDSSGQEATVVGVQALCMNREFQHKSNITFNDNDTVSFLEYYNFQSQREVQWLGELLHCQAQHPGPECSIGDGEYVYGPKTVHDLGVHYFGECAFMNHTIGKIMWGYDHPPCTSSINTSQTCSS